jgi:hypothetical protein
MTRIYIRFGAPQEYEAELTWISRKLVVRPQLLEDKIPLPQFRPGGLLTCIRSVYVKRNIAVHSLLQQRHSVVIVKGWRLTALRLLVDAVPENFDGFLTLTRYAESVRFPIQFLQLYGAQFSTSSLVFFQKLVSEKQTFTPLARIR